MKVISSEGKDFSQQGHISKTNKTSEARTCYDDDIRKGSFIKRVNTNDFGYHMAGKSENQRLTNFLVEL